MMRKGELAKEALINNAVRLFGEYGIEAIGTRELSAASSVPMSSIAYHFGNREGIKRAALMRAATLFSADIVQMTSGVDNDRNRAAAALKDIVAVLAERVRRPDAAAWTSLLIQGLLLTDDAAQQMQRSVLGPLIAVITPLIELTRDGVGSLEARGDAMLTLAAILGRRLVC